VTHSVRRSLGRELLLPMIGLATVAALAFAWMTIDWALEARRLGAEVRLVRAANALLYELEQLSRDAQRAVLYHQTHPGPASRAAVEGAEAQANRAADRVAALALPARGRRLWREFIAGRRQRLALQGDLLDAAASAATMERAAFARWDLASERETALLADFGVYDVKRLDWIVREAEARRAGALAALAATLLAAAAALSVVALRIRRRVVRPLLAMSATAERIALEKVALPVEGAGRQDEIGLLARALNQMTADLVLASQRLAEALALRDEFLSIASHELKTPLTSLKLQLEGASRRLEAAGTPLPPWMGAAQRQVRRLEALIEQLLDMSRIRAGRLSLDLESTDLSEVARTAAGRLAHELERAGNVLQLELAPGVSGRWDPGRLDQIVTNLVSNAVKYAPGTPVSLRVRAEGERGILEVEDGGSGVPEELRARVFDPFERGATARALGGLGLGLFIVRQIVEAHGGEVRVENTPAGGARFVVVLPMTHVASGVVPSGVTV
jgi:signal transduction histidine kinase